MQAEQINKSEAMDWWEGLPEHERINHLHRYGYNYKEMIWPEFAVDIYHQEKLSVKLSPAQIWEISKS